MYSAIVKDLYISLGEAAAMLESALGKRTTLQWVNWLQNMRARPESAVYKDVSIRTVKAPSVLVSKEDLVGYIGAQKEVQKAVDRASKISPEQYVEKFDLAQAPAPARGSLQELAMNAAGTYKYNLRTKEAAELMAKLDGGVLRNAYQWTSWLNSNRNPSPTARPRYKVPFKVGEGMRSVYLYSADDLARVLRIEKALAGKGEWNMEDAKWADALPR